MNVLRTDPDSRAEHRMREILACRQPGVKGLDAAIAEATAELAKDRELVAMLQQIDRNVAWYVGVLTGRINSVHWRPNHAHGPHCRFGCDCRRDGPPEGSQKRV